LIDVLDGFIPYTTTFLERRNDGWHTNYKESNEYVKEKIEDDEYPYTEQYHSAWSEFTRKKELVELIKNFEPLETKSALEVLEKVTGIKADVLKIKK